MSATATASDKKSNAEKAAKKARKKEALKGQAASMGISYDELKEQKKRKKREAEQLENVEHQTDMKRMRTWSKDFDDPTIKKQNITRSMDTTLAREETTSPDMSAEEWRNMHDIKVQGHGRTDDKKFPDPFLNFADTPFCAAIQKSFSQAGFDKPTHIQSQVLFLHIDMMYPYICDCTNT